MFKRALFASLLLLTTSLTAAAETIKIDGRGPGLAFDGLGGLSAGAGTRLLPGAEKGTSLIDRLPRNRQYQ